MRAGEDLALLTDLYQLTMAQSYFQNRRFEPATFSLFARVLPQNRGYLIAAGIDDVLEFLENFRLNDQAIDYLRSKKLFADDFLDYLKTLRFTGEVWAIPEGRLFFAEEPILEVTAPVIEAQIVETFIINQINLQSLIATKAARCVYAARGRSVIDFSLRRTHGTDAGLKVARASYLAGFGGTSNVLAGRCYGIPIVGTMAHSFVTSFEREIDAFRAFVASFPAHSILLIDTYETLAAARKAVVIAREMAARGQRLQGVRIDSGDLARDAFEVRRIFDDAGFTDIRIVGSGGLDEYDLEQLSERNAPFDSYGVGTKMGVSADAPWLDMAYKLVEYHGRPVLKLSTGKVSWPGRKQIYRISSQGRMQRDVVALRADEPPAGAEPLLRKVMQGGKRAGESQSLNQARARFLSEFEALPQAFKQLRNPARYPVEFTPALIALREATQRKITDSG